MSLKNNIAAIVPVKGNSERVSKKNIRPFCGSTLLEVKLAQLEEVTSLKKVIVSSEDEEVLDLAKSFDVELHKRDPSYSTSDVPMSDVYTYLANEFPEYETIMWVNVTNPLAEASVYEEAIKKYHNLEPKYDCLLSVTEIQDYFIFRDKYLNFVRNPWPRSQDLEPLKAINFVTNILKREDLARWGSLVGENPYFWSLDSISSMDIDFPEDFEFCEFMYRKRNS